MIAKRSLDDILDSSERGVIEQIAKNPQITLEELRKALSLSMRQVRKAINSLAQKKIIIRIDGKRYGKWEIVVHQKDVKIYDSSK